MPTTTLFDKTGGEVGTIDLPDALFAGPVNEAVMHQAVVAQLAGRRTGTHDTRTRGEVRGGGAKGPGIGLGLATVKRLVERHGGEVGVRPAEGHGSVFWFTLPAAA